MARLLTVYGLSQELGMSVASLRRWLEEGAVQSPKRIGGGVQVFDEKQTRQIKRAVLARRLGRVSGALPRF
ncbi:MAG: MerR family transcriptional regulator [Gemmatimonadota bacterium]|nr:MAG: MerR family transcriptional regulator [Gemmatimonadota bacterium]